MQYKNDTLSYLSLMKHFNFYSREDILFHTHLRRFETKLGERIDCIPRNTSLESTLKQTASKFVLFGIPEDIGVKANQLPGGTDASWFPFLSAFLNIQSNDFLGGENILLIGHFDFTQIKLLIDSNAATAEEKLEAYRHAVNTIDDEVENLVRIITEYDKIPIIIGGGQNNAYPAIKGAAKGLYKKGILALAQINCINLDGQADYRPTEGRHSGNAFRYAEEDGYLGKYFIMGLHENNLQQNVWTDIVNNPFIDFISYEDIFIHCKTNFIQALANATGFTEDSYAGIELDLDCIEGEICSTSSPSGLTVLNARQYMNFVATDVKVAYVHICEGATKTADNGEDINPGKLISYLVSDFIKAHSSR